MKNKLMKQMVAFVMVVLVGLVSLGTGVISVKADTTVTDEQVQAIVERNKIYRNQITSEDGWGAEAREAAKAFGLADIDGDGCEDLVVRSYDGEAFKNPGAFAIYKEGEITFVWDEWVACSIYYSPITNCFMLSYNDAKPNSEWDWGGYSIYEFSDESATDVEYLVSVSKQENQAGYDEIYIDGEDCTETCTEEELNEIVEQYMPEFVLLEAPYEITKENLDKYLPIKEKVVRQMLEAEAAAKDVTTKEVTLKVGEVFGLSTANIDKLLKEAGSEYASTMPSIYYGERVTMDSKYLEAASGAGVHDEATDELIEMIYLTDAEWPVVLEKWESGELDTQYGTKVILVDEAAGMSYYVKAAKTGETTIVIPEYEVENTTIKVSIPVVIEEDSKPETDSKPEDDKKPETDSEPEDNKKPENNKSENIITSNTDKNIVIKNKDNVLPAGTTLKSEKLEKGENYDLAKKLVEKVNVTGNFAIYELNLFDADEIEIHQLIGEVEVTMDVPLEVSKGYTLEVYRVDGEELTECKSTIIDGKLIFTTNHFSTYVFNEVKEIPKTGDSSHLYFYAVLLMAGCVILYKNKKTA